jgi:YVTN family beta-propeller protein
MTKRPQPLADPLVMVAGDNLPPVGGKRMFSSGSADRHTRVAVIFTCVLLLLQSQLLMLPAFAESPGPVPVNLDLTSTARDMSPSNRAASATLSINVGGTTRNITPTSSLTPGEMLAAHQVFSSGQQSILLSLQGNAVGGSFSMSEKFSQFVSSLVIPQGVTAVKDFTSSTVLSLLGNLTNSGNLYAVSNTEHSTATISASNIFNQPGGLISTVLPASGLPGYANAARNMNLSLIALNNIVNAGTITSSGHLSLTAGGAIVNALPAGTAGAQPVMQAMNDISLTANSITNAGLISSMTGNLNVQAMAASNLAINNANGSMQALAGKINLGDPLNTLKTNISVTGGDFLSHELNVYSGDGTANIFVNQISGRMNISAGAAHAMVSSGSLHLGNLKLSGDPTFYNDGSLDAGDIIIGGDIEVGEALTIVARRNILTNGDHSITAHNATRGFDINLVAGAHITSAGSAVSPVVGPFGDPPPADVGTPADTPVVINGPSNTGGNIDFSSNKVTISSAAVAVTGDHPGGNIRLIAYTKVTSGGHILISQDSTINTGGIGSGANGNVLIIAGGDNTAISTGAISTIGGTGGGAITISGSEPRFTGSTSSLTFGTDGSIISGNDFEPDTSPLQGNIVVNGNLTASGPVAITATGSGNIVTQISQTDTVSVGFQPAASGISPDGLRAYIANRGAGTVSVIDTDTNTVIGTPITVGASPNNIAFTPDGSKVYVSNTGDDTISVIDTTNPFGTPGLISGLVGPSSVVFTPDGSRAYVANSATNTVSVVDVATGQIVGSAISVDNNPRSVVITPDGKFVYVNSGENGGSNAVRVIQTSDNSVLPVSIATQGLRPAFLAMNPNGLYVYSTNLNSGDVSIIDTATNSVVGSPIGVGGTPETVFVNPQGTQLYVSVVGDSMVRVYQIVGNTIENPVDIPLSGPRASGNFVGVVGNNVVAYVPSFDNDEVAVITLPSISGTNVDLTSNTGKITAGTVGTGTIGAHTSNPGSVFLTHIGAANLGGSAALGSSFTLGATGNVTASGDVIASSLTLQNTVSNGSITFGANLDAISVTLTTIGATSKVLQTAGTITASSLVFNTAQLGDSSSAIKLLTDQNLTLTVPVFADIVDIRTTANDSDLTFKNTVTGVTSLNLQANGSGSILTQNAVLAVPAVGQQPIGVAVNPAGTFAYVANRGSSSVSVVRTSDNAIVANVPVGGDPNGLGLTPDGAFVYVANFGGESVSVIRTSDNTVVDTITVGGEPIAVAVNPAGTFAYVTDSENDQILVIRTSDNAVLAPIPGGDRPWNLAFTPDGSFLYVTNDNGESVSVIRTSDNTVTDTIPLGGTGRGIAIDPTGTFAYAVNSETETTKVIRLSDNTIIDSVSTPSPFGIAISPSGTFAYVADNNNSVTVIRTSDNSVVSPVTLGVPATGVAIDPNGRFAYVTSFQEGKLSVISLPALVTPSISMTSSNGDINVETNAGTLTANTGGNVTVTERDAISLGASNIGGNLFLGAQGAITTSAAVSATGMNLQSLANITVGANLDATSLILTTVGATSKILQTAGTITISSLVLNSSQLGDSSSLIKVRTDQSVTFTAPVFGNTVDIRSTANDANLVFGEDVTSSASMVLRADGLGNIEQQGGAVFTAGTTLELRSVGGNLGTSVAPLSVSIISLDAQTTGGDVFVENDNAFNPLSVVASSGNARYSLTSNHGIALSGDIGATLSVALSSGDGNIFGADINSPDVSLTSTSGNVGSVFVPLNLLGADTLSVDVGGSAFLTNNIAVNISDSSAGGSLVLRNTGKITAANVEAEDLTLDATTGGIELVDDIGASLGNTTLFARGDFSIEQSNGSIFGQLVTLRSDTGDIGTLDFPLATTTGFLSARTRDDGMVGIINSGSLILNNSGSGGDLVVHATGGLTLNSLSTLAPGSILIAVADDGSLSVAPGARITSNGTLIFQNTDTIDGSILLGSNSFIGSADGSVLMFIGAAPPSNENQVKPANITASTLNGGEIFYGQNSIKANLPTNFITANGADQKVIFSTGNLPATAITLNGGVRIQSTANFFVTSLDLNDADAVAFIQEQQADKVLGGQLIVSGGVATGGTLIISPSNLSASLTAVNIPSGVTATFNAFTSATAVNVDLNVESTTPSVTVSGTLQFMGTGTNGVMNIATDISSPVLIINSATTANKGLISSGNLLVNAGGDVQLSGPISASNLQVVATGSIAIGTVNIGKAGKPMTLETTGTGTITQEAGTSRLLGNLITLGSDTGAIGDSANPIRTTAATLSFNSQSDVFVSSNVATAINAGSFVESLSLTSTGSITIKGAVIGSETILLTALGSATIKQLALGLLTAQEVSLLANTGAIGTSSLFIKTSSEVLSANTSGAVYLSPVTSVTLEASSGGIFQMTGITASNSIDIGGVLSAKTITIKNNTPGGTIGILTNIQGQGVTPNAVSVTLATIDSGRISMFPGTITQPSISTTNLVLSSASGDLGPIGIGRGPIRTNASTVSFKTSGTVNITGIGTLTSFNNSSGGDVTITAENVKLIGALKVGDISMTTGGGTITQSSSGTKIFGNTIDLQGANGIGTLAIPIGVSNSLTSGTAGLHLLSPDGSVFIAGASSLETTANSSADGTFSVKSTRDITLNNTLTASTILLTAGTAFGIKTTLVGVPVLNSDDITLTAGTGGIGTSALIGLDGGPDPINLTVKTTKAAGIATFNNVNLRTSNATGGLTVISDSDIQVIGKLTASGGLLSLSANGGNLDVSSIITAKLVGLSALVAVQLNANVSGTAGVTLNTAIGGNVFISPVATLASSNSNIAITTDMLDFGGNVKAGTGTVTLTPAEQTKHINFNGTVANDFNVTTAQLNRITAKNVQIGIPNDLTGGISALGTYTAPSSGAGSFNITFFTNGDFTATGATLNLGTKSLAINSSDALLSTGVLNAGLVGINSIGNVGITGGTINATTVILGALNGGIGTGALALNANAANLNVQTADQAFVHSNRSLILTGAGGGLSSTGTLQLTVDGNINVTGSVFLQDVALATTGNGNITTTGAGTIGAVTASLSSTSGNIGTASVALKTAVGLTLSANTAGTGLVNIANSSSGVSLLSSTSGGSFKFVNNGSFNVGYLDPVPVPVIIPADIAASTNAPANIAKSTDFVQLVASGGTLTVMEGSTITANGGNVILQNKDALNGSIAINDTASILASSTNTAGGNVSIFVGTSAVAIPGQLPANITPNISTKGSANGQIFFGDPGPVVATGTNNEVNAEGRKVTFSGRAGSITIGNINGGVTITADPPASPPVVTQTPEYQNISFVTPTGAALTGTQLFVPEKDSVISTAFGEVSVGAGAVVLVVAMHNGIAIYDLHDSRNNHVAFTNGDTKFALAPGRHLLVTDLSASDYESINPFGAISHRMLQKTDVGSTRAFVSEFSILSALKLKPLVELGSSSWAQDRRVINQLLKNAAIIQTTRGALGGYQRFGTSRSYATAQK